MHTDILLHHWRQLVYERGGWYLCSPGVLLVCYSCEVFIAIRCAAIRFKDGCQAQEGRSRVPRMAVIYGCRQPVWLLPLGSLQHNMLATSVLLLSCGATHGALGHICTGRPSSTTYS